MLIFVCIVLKSRFVYVHVCLTLLPTGHKSFCLPYFFPILVLFNHTHFVNMMNLNAIFLLPSLLTALSYFLENE